MSIFLSAFLSLSHSPKHKPIFSKTLVELTQSIFFPFSFYVGLKKKKVFIAMQISIWNSKYTKFRINKGFNLDVYDFCAEVKWLRETLLSQFFTRYWYSLCHQFRHVLQKKREEFMDYKRYKGANVYA